MVEVTSRNCRVNTWHGGGNGVPEMTKMPIILTQGDSYLRRGDNYLTRGNNQVRRTRASITSIPEHPQIPYRPLKSAVAHRCRMKHYGPSLGWQLTQPCMN